jgi:signal transduction histidine kinase/DNA-binding response OmpR family regulator/PAS domain-containing protein
LANADMNKNGTDNFELSERRAAIVDGINKAIDIFTSHSEKEFDDVISRGLRPIADAARLDRVVFYRRLVIDGELRFGQIYKWDKAEKGLVSLDDELRILPKIPVLENWIAVLSKNDPVRIRESDMNEDERAFLRGFGVKSILIIPIFSHDEFWGAVALQDHNNDQYFDEGCSDLLYTSARICANAIIRSESRKNANEVMEEMRRRENIATTLNNMAALFLSQSGGSFETMMTEGVRLIADMIDLDRMSVWRNFNRPDGLYSSQVYRWEKKSGGTTIPTAELENVAYYKYIPNWEDILKNGGIINGPARLQPEREAAVLKNFGTLSVFVTSVFINNDFWGMVIYEDLCKERYFEEEFTEIMCSAAFLCANIVMRYDMENRIASASEFNRAMLDAAPIGFTIFDENIQIIECNDAILKMFKTTKQYYTEHFFDFSPEYQPDGHKSKDRAVELIANTLKGEKQAIEWIHRSGTGEMIPFEVTMSRTMYNGKYMVLCYQYDLLNIKKMEHIIAEESDFNRAVVDALRIGFTAFDENLRIIEVNNASLNFFGCEKQYFIEHFFEFVPGYQPDGFSSYGKTIELLKRALNGENITVEWTHLTPAGELLPFEVTLTRTKYKGKYIVLSYQYDLRNTRKMTEELKKQSELLKVRLEQQELLSEISRSFVSSGESKTLVNEAIAKLGHYHKVSMVVIFSLDNKQSDTHLAYFWTADGRRPHGAKLNLYELVKSSFPERLYDRATVPVLSCTDTAASDVEDFRALSAVDVNAFICAPLYVEGSLWGILAAEQCFKPRIWAESEKSFVAIMASTLASAIMLDIYNSKLKDAVNKLTAASKAKSEFLSNMSHEMRTPMNAIINMTVIAKNTPDIERKNYALEKIEDASTHLLGVINDILDMSKIEAKKFDLVPVEFVFEKMLQRVVNVVNFRVEEKSQKLMIHIDKDIPKTLIGDDQRLSQVITNLLGNAVKFTPENGSINLKTRFLGEEDGVCNIQISVSDTGIGISAEQQKRLFQSFQQAETSTVRKYGGTGLGLSISKSIVEMMGGKIWIESELNKGSTFAFTIKAKRGEDKKTNLREKAINWDIIRILAVDDDPDILAFFRDVAQRFNLHCDTASDGESALALVREKSNYNIYFIDWKMPGMDGIALTNAIRGTERGSDNSIIIMISAVDWNAIKDQAQNAGIDRFLSKPLFPSAVIDAISECLGVDRNKMDGAKKKGDDFTGHRVLLVEDMEINREIVLALLESTNLEIDCAENGVQAVNMFSSDPEKYEVIFMDVQMPEMDGYEATGRIRLIETDLLKKQGNHRKRVPIIAMTANVFKEDIERCRNAGMDDHLGKPLDLEIVMEKLRTYLN